jgi:F-type H+-transporting ATPase subunit epsilon
MANFPFELVSPERVLFSGEATQVVVPAAEGEITVLANHAPFMSALRTGVLTIDNRHRLFVRGGFADVSPAGLTVLAEQAVPLDEINAEALSGQIRSAEEDLRDAKSDDVRARAQGKLDGLNAMMVAIRN